MPATAGRPARLAGQVRLSRRPGNLAPAQIRALPEAELVLALELARELVLRRAQELVLRRAQEPVLVERAQGREPELARELERAQVLAAELVLEREQELAAQAELEREQVLEAVRRAASS